MQEIVAKLGKRRSAVRYQEAKRTDMFGWQVVLRFENGYGLSIIGGMKSPIGMNIDLLWGHDCEAAVLRFTGPGAREFQLVYNTPATSDVIRGSFDDMRVLAGQVRSWRRGQWDHMGEARWRR